jgi:hypothetical protein
VRQEGVVHVLEEERRAVERVQRDAVGSVGAEALLAGVRCAAVQRDCLGNTHSFTRSSCSFLGIMSSMCGSSAGYNSSTLVRIARCALDLTLDLAPDVMLAAH